MQRKWLSIPSLAPCYLIVEVFLFTYPFLLQGIVKDPHPGLYFSMLKWASRHLPDLPRFFKRMREQQSTRVPSIPHLPVCFPLIIQKMWCGGEGVRFKVELLLKVKNCSSNDLSKVIQKVCGRAEPKLPGIESKLPESQTNTTKMRISFVLIKIQITYDRTRSKLFTKVRLDHQV